LARTWDRGVADWRRRMDGCDNSLMTARH
jgi:hypothetical protein